MQVNLIACRFNNKKSEEKTRTNGYLITDLLLLYALLLLTPVFELQRPIFGRVPCEFQQRQDHSVYKENNAIIWMVNIFIFVLLQCKSVEHILYGGHHCKQQISWKVPIHCESESLLMT